MKSFFAFTLCAAQLFIFSSSQFASANVISDTVKLIDVPIGSSIQIRRDMRAEQGQIFSSLMTMCAVALRKGYGARDLKEDDLLRIQSIKALSNENLLEILLEGPVYQILCTPRILNFSSSESLTIKDLRKAFGWAFWVNDSTK